MGYRVNCKCGHKLAEYSREKPLVNGGAVRLGSQVCIIGNFLTMKCGKCNTITIVNELIGEQNEEFVPKVEPVNTWFKDLGLGIRKKIEEAKLKEKSKRGE